MQKNFFISKAKNIVKDNLDKESFGVTELASKLGLSRSQLLRKIKNQTGQSTNLFIRDIRLSESLLLLKNTDLTISEIAFKTGFGSPSYFNKVFREKYGITPGEYKLQDTIELKPVSNDQKFGSFKAVSILLTLIFLIVFLFYQGLHYFSVDKLQSKNPSIAVLPFLDLSENNDKAYLTYGLMDAIITELAKIKNLRVISRGSSMYFMDSAYLYKEIANILDVQYLLEGSILFDEDSLRINVQLIDPLPDEKHLWANNYVKESSNIFYLANSISSEIAKKVTGQLYEEALPEDNYLVNEEAYEYYLRGKFLFENQNPSSVYKAIEYLNHSIEIDSNIAQSYSLLADCYISLNKLIPNQEEKLQNRIESRKAIDHALNRALQLNESLASAYFTQANIKGKFDWDWEGMRMMAEKGLEIEPNNPYGYMILSNYWTKMQNPEKAILNAKVAYKLDPINPRIGVLLAEKFEFAGKYSEAIKKYEEVIELFPGYGFAWNGIGMSYYLCGDKEMARESWKNLHEIMGNQEMANFFTTHNFDESIQHYLEEVRMGSKLFCSNPPIIAMAHIFGNDFNGALDYLEFAQEYKNEDLPILINSPIFQPLLNLPNFKSIQESLN